jgi:hypothetical protein
MTNAGYKFSDTIAKGYSLSSSYNNYFEITSKNTEIFDGIPQGEYILIQLDGYNYDKSIYSYNEKTGDISYSIYDLNKTYQKLMENVSKNGVSLYENYEPIIYTINWYIDGQNSPFRVEKFYKYEYINKVLNLTAPLNVGDSLDNGNYYVESGLNVWTKITGVVSSYDKEITPVTQDENYTIRYNASEYSLQYIDKTTNIVLLAKMLKVGDTVPDLTADDIMLAYADRNIQSVSDISYTKVDSMPSHCLKIYTTFTSILGKINVVFKSLGENVSSYDSKGVVSVDASNNSVYTYSGDYTKISQYDYYNGSYDFVAPTLDAKAVYDETTEIYKKAIAWQLVEKNGIAIQNGEIVYSGHKMRFLQNSVYEPIYATYGKEFTIQFGSIDQFGNAYTYASVSGLYKGKILDEILKLNNIANPTRIDRNNANTYTFDGWGIDTSTYKVGSEVDISGEELTKITFNAKWITKKNIYTYTFDANGGKFDDNSTQKVLSGGYNDNVNYESLIPTKSSDANNFYVFVGWNEVRSDDVGIVDNTFASQNKTYYAVYSAGEVARTLTINAGEINGVNGYADDNKSTITYTNVYDGEVITLYANRFTLKNNDITAKPYYIINSTNDKIIYFSNEDDSSVELKVNGNEVYTVYYNNCETRLFYVQLNAYTNQTVIYDSSSKVYSEGTSSLFGYVHGKLLTQKYGTSIDLPIAYNYDTSKNLIFKGWVSKNGDGSYSEVINKLVVDNDYTLYPYFEIDNDATVSLTFIAEPYYNDNVSRQNLSASGKILGVPHFADGTDEKVVLGKKNNAIGAIETPNLTGCKFVGWRTADSTAILTTLGNVGNFDSNITYYASYELSDSYSVTLNAGNGKFSNGESSKVVSANYGTITSTLETPVCLDTQKVFSYYADENGNKVETISKDATYTAHYAYAISTIKDLQNISNRLGADFVLTKDIELGITDENDKLILQDYTPIGIYDNLGFTGEFNGNGYSITFAFDASNFEYSGIFAKLSGKVFDLISCAVPYFKNDTNCIASGSIAGIIEGSGIIKNCRCARFAGIAGNVISSSNTISIGTIAGINNGNISNVIIDREGLSTPQILTDGTLNFGTAVGINNGTILSVLTTMGQNGISLARSINCNIGGLVGNNSGIIKNCVVGSSSYITYLNGDNYFEDNCIKFGRISAVDSGKIENCYMNSGIGYCIENITLLGKKCEISFQDSNCYCISILDKTENPSSLISYRVYFKGYTGAKTNESTDYYFDDYTDSLKLSSFDNKIIGYNVSNGNNYSSCFEIDSIVKTKMPYYTNLSELDSMYMLYLLSHLW